MKRKKLLALVMTAALTITGTGQTAGVLAAEFTDAEEYVSPQADAAVSGQDVDGGNTGETVQREDTDIFSSDAEESDAEPDIAEEPEEDQEFPNMEEDIFQEEGPEESDELELPDAEESEEELFSSGQPEEAFADGEDEEILSAEAVKADYRGVLISKAEFDHLIQTGEGPGGEWVEKKGTSFADFMKNFANKTGYLLVAAENNQGYEDMVIPEGLTVVIACGSAIHIKSITPKGNIYIWENVFTPGTLEIKEGKGSVTFKDSPVDGAIVGKGSNDTVILDGGWVDVSGLKGVENIVISEGFEALSIWGGSSEFYNITNNHKNCENIRLQRCRYSIRRSILERQKIRRKAK